MDLTKKINSYTMHNEILLSFIKKKTSGYKFKITKESLIAKTLFSVRFFLLKTVFISVSPCYQNYTLSHFHQISNLYRDS